jgi:LPXTG-motif cell wall-anchored protein
VGVIGTSASNDGQFDAFANRSGPAGGELGAHMFGGDSTPFTSEQPFQFISYGALAPSASVALVPAVTLFEELSAGFLLQCSTLEEPEDPASPTVPTYVDLTVLEIVYDGGVIVPGSEPLPNQAPIVVPGLGTISLNEQVRTVVDGWEIITATALHIVTPTDDIRLGVVECAQPAAAQLAATGADRADAQLGLAGGVMLALAGIVLVLGRRRRAV